MKHNFTADFGNKDEIIVELKNLPVSQRFGTNVLILSRGGDRQFLGTIARSAEAARRRDDRQCAHSWRGRFCAKKPWMAKIYARMGIRGWRAETSWNAKQDASRNWEEYDAMFAAAKEVGCKIMAMPGATPTWTWPFAPHQTPGQWLQIGTAARMEAARTGYAIRNIIPITRSG